MDAIENRAKHEKITELIHIIKGYIFTIKKYDLEVEYEIEISYFKQIIKGLLIDDALDDTLSKPFSKGADARPIFSVLYKEHIKPVNGSMCDMEYIEATFSKLYEKKHDLRNNLFYMDSYPEVKLINNMLEIPWPRHNRVDSAIRNVRREMKKIKKEMRELEK